MSTTTVKLMGVCCFTKLKSTTTQCLLISTMKTQNYFQIPQHAYKEWAQSRTMVCKSCQWYTTVRIFEPDLNMPCQTQQILAYLKISVQAHYCLWPRGKNLQSQVDASDLVVSDFFPPAPFPSPTLTCLRPNSQVHASHLYLAPEHPECKVGYTQVPCKKLNLTLIQDPKFMHESKFQIKCG